ncbi:Nucleolar MIF4G domain-containing protein 1 [Phytophthora pseudosyringae]|uniref:Nucleolar MIF4G domain-containing protein 1 n=1 Tax=Phytophthora pseudosyringae TaxID=221518 RepID=A0A8T1VCN7_9STRA|nr:Nucleolar MIF4G domain-containing protein 1 [Phytophthora pseudosyringae]
MIPPVKQEAATMVTIAPTPSAQPQSATANQTQLQPVDNQSNAALEITQQPPETWYKDQYGRKATFELQLKRTETVCAQCVEQRILSVQLLYESGKVVEKQEILHAMSGQCLDKNRQSTLAIRIAEVSKNHLNQRFRVEIAVPRCLGSCDYKTSVVSDPVLVLSKKKKRPVKQNAESPAKQKKAKRALAQDTPKRNLSSDSPDSSQSSTTTLTGNVTAAIAEMEEAIPMRAADATAPFTPETPNLCLWSNAAFDLLYKLQWQRVPARASDKPGANLDEILAQALSKAFKCPSCQETYGQIPTHRDDCDLKLLLEQGGQTETPATETANNLTAHHSLQWSSDKQLEWPDRPQAMYSGGDTTPKIQASPCNLSQEMHKPSGPESGNAQTPVNRLEFPAAAGLNISTWKDYASISKLLYSTSYMDPTSPHAGAVPGPTVQWTGVLPPVGTLAPGFPTLPSATKYPAMQQAGGVQQILPSQRFSALLAATKGMSTDVADLFRESEAALHGDGNIVSSMNSMNLSDFLRPNPGAKYASDQQLGHRPISLSALLPNDQPASSENGVQIIMASDFQGCGFPALDASFNLAGFYFVLTETHTNPAELRFGPHVFPLPEEMLQELKNTLAEWRGNPSICYQRESAGSNAVESLAHMKRTVLQQVTR